ENCRVSFLELFHDLVYVVVIARAAHTLANNVSWHGVPHTPPTWQQPQFG
ncbi:MAG: low temperature requirement protein A, partial [Actinomycetia bacterium]|nr:low temperature requirement protein A [Actinomycetes bacterium]